MFDNTAYKLKQAAVQIGINQLLCDMLEGFPYTKIFAYPGIVENKYVIDEYKYTGTHYFNDIIWPFYRTYSIRKMFKGQYEEELIVNINIEKTLNQLYDLYYKHKDIDYIYISKEGLIYNPEKTDNCFRLHENTVKMLLHFRMHVAYSNWPTRYILFLIYLDLCRYTDVDDTKFDANMVIILLS